METVGKRGDGNKLEIGENNNNKKNNNTVIHRNEIKRVHLVYRYLNKL